MEWVDVDEAGRTWRFDAAFLTSNWTCIWDRGCAGIDDVADVPGQLGCCSVGAEMLDEEEAMTIAALGATVSPERLQFAEQIALHGALSEDRRSTRVVDGACVFLNRPGFAGGAGCALHAEALANGESPVDWKPSVCWQLPLKIDRSEDGSVLTVRRWGRSDWGSDGQRMAYCCTERDSPHADAFVGETPVVVSLRSELDALVGAEVVDRLVERLPGDST